LGSGIDAGTLSDRVFAALEHAIIEGELPAGMRLRADELASRFQISRIPVREALRSLATEGWVELRPRHGASVRSRTNAELEELFEMRLILEVGAAGRAAERRTEHDLGRLDELVAAGNAAVAAGDGAEFARINERFHMLVTECAHNETLTLFAQRIGKRVRFYYKTVVTGRGRASAAEHAEIVDAIRRQDGKRAAELTASHVEATQRALRAVLAQGDVDMELRA
jgi:DNA-binding GntR family transcriptional regulator